MTRVDKIIRKLAVDSKKSFSLEFLPPKRYQEMDSYLQTIDSLVSYGPSWITLTYHQEKLIEKNGTLVPKRFRAGSDVISAHLSGRYREIPVVPHFICGGFTREDTERGLIQLPYAEIDNVFCIRGDENTPTKKGPVFSGKKGGHLHASGLVKQIADLRDAKYVHPDAEASPLDLSIGVAGYPEKHHEAESIEDCLKYVKLKQDLGADYIVLQMCFDNEKILAYRDLAVKSGITIPIIPGLKILDSKSQVEIIPRLFHVEIPEKLRNDILEAEPNTENTHNIGQTWALKQAETLYNEGFPVVHFYTMNRPASVGPVLEALF